MNELLRFSFFRGKFSSWCRNLDSLAFYSIAPNRISKILPSPRRSISGKCYLLSLELRSYPPPVLDVVRVTVTVVVTLRVVVVTLDDLLSAVTVTV